MARVGRGARPRGGQERSEEVVDALVLALVPLLLDTAGVPEAAGFWPWLAV